MIHRKIISKLKILYRFILLIAFSTTTAKAQLYQSLFLDKQDYTCATNFNISARAKNIRNVVALQGTVSWDTAIIKYVGISFGTSLISLNNSNMNLLSTAKGYLTFLWYDNNLTGQTVINDSSLFTINFSRNGIGKGKTSVIFNSSPTTLEIDTLDNVGFPKKDNSAIFSNGYIITPKFYVFNGFGNWDEATNWVQNIIPPSVLPICSEIIISPNNSTECILNIKQTISPGAKITIMNDKKLIINESLLIK